MLEKGLYERYVPERTYEPIGRIRLYRGLDQLLKRDILLAIWERKGGDLPVVPPRTPGLTLEVLDYGKTEDENYIVYEYIPGLPLYDAIEAQRLPLKEALGMIIKIIEILQSLATEGRGGLRLIPENFWLTEKGALKALDFWDDTWEKGKEITDLFHLFHRMIFGKVNIPLPPRQILEEISLSYQGNPYVVRKTLKSILHREEKQEQPFSFHLHTIHEDLTSLYQYIKSTQTKPDYRDEMMIETKKGKKTPLLSVPEKDQVKGWFSSHRRFVFRFAMILVLLSVIGIGGKMLYAKLFPSVNTQKPTPFQVVVPNVVGMTQAKADQTLKEQGVQYQYYIEKSPLNKSGTVIKQNPTPGQFMYRSELVELWIAE